MKAYDTTPLGRTGLQVSRLGLGLASLGGMFEPVPESQALATVDRAWAEGLRLFDTAPVYGYGRSEQQSGAGSARPALATSTYCAPKWAG